MTQELAQFDELKAVITQFVAPTLSIQVSDPISSQQAIDVGKDIKAYIAQVEKKRKELVGPLNNQVKTINDYVKTIMAPLDQAEAHVKKQLNQYASELEKIRQEAIRKAELERKEVERKLAEERARAEGELRAKHQEEAQSRQEAADLFGAEDAPSPNEIQRQAELERLELEAKFERERISNIVDYKQKEYDAGQEQIKGLRMEWKCEAVDLNLVPREFLIIELNTKAILAAARAGVKIAGVRTWQEPNVAIGSKTYMPKALK